MIRVLQVYPQINNAGTERVIFNLYENINTDEVQFDFLTERSGEQDSKIYAMGGKIYCIEARSMRDYYTALVSFFHSHPEYKIVHTHTSSHMAVVLKAAKKCGIPCRIAHSHNARTDLPKAAALIKSFKSLPIEKNATHFFACSLSAAKWLFPHKFHECKVLYNGIKLEDYLFNMQSRIKVRSSLGISDKTFVMLHVGRFARQKNHEFLVKILERYNTSHSDWMMLLMGEGPTMDSIKSQVQNAGLSSHVVFLGARSDVSKFYSAADMFIFPSLHEGLGITVIEAQANGLPCIVSDAIPPEADMDLGLLNFLSLKDDAEQWVRAIDKHNKNISSRECNNKAVLDGKYNIKQIALQMQRFYMENGK